MMTIFCVRCTKYNIKIRITLTQGSKSNMKKEQNYNEESK